VALLVDEPNQSDEECHSGSRITDLIRPPQSGLSSNSGSLSRSERKIHPTHGRSG
jgi:hypothetical protein